METVTLYREHEDGNEIYRAHYLSRSGAMWVPDSVTDEDLACDICGRMISSGFTCLDGGEFICAEHVETVPASIGRKLAREFSASMDFHNAFVSMRTHIGAAVLEVFESEHKPKRYLGWTQPTDSALASVGLDRESFESGSRGTLPVINQTESPYAR